MNQPATNINTLHLSNMQVDESVLFQISHNLLPQLYSLELNDIRFHSKKSRTLLEEMYLNMPQSEDNLPLMKLKVSNIDLSRQVSYLNMIIEKCYCSLLDLDVSWCNMSFNNVKELFKCLCSIGLQDAKSYDDGQVRGTIRMLNLSFNPMWWKEKEGPADKKKKKKPTII